MPDTSANNDNKAEIANEKEGSNGNSKQDTLFCQCPIKQLLCKVKKKLIKKHYIDISNYTSSKPCQPQPISFYLTSLKGKDINNNDVIDIADGKLKIIVIYKQQS